MSIPVSYISFAITIGDRFFSGKTKADRLGSNLTGAKMYVTVEDATDDLSMVRSVRPLERVTVVKVVAMVLRNDD